VAFNPSALASSNKFTDLRKRLVFLLLALIVYRIGAHIPVPGIDPSQLKQLFDSQQGGILGMFNLFSGGALSRFTVFALGIMPYISASIVMQLRGGSSQDYPVHTLWHLLPCHIPSDRYFNRSGISGWLGNRSGYWIPFHYGRFFGHRYHVFDVAG